MLPASKWITPSQDCLISSLGKNEFAALLTTVEEVVCYTSSVTANLRTNIIKFRGFDLSIRLIIMGGILMSTGYFLESLRQAILAGIILVGRLGRRQVVPLDFRHHADRRRHPPRERRHEDLIHPVSITRFPSFRTQPLENLSHYL